METMMNLYTIYLYTSHYIDYIYNLYDKLYKDMLKNNLITFELAYWCKLHQ